MVRYQQKFLWMQVLTSLSSLSIGRRGFREMRTLTSKQTNKQTMKYFFFFFECFSVFNELQKTFGLSYERKKHSEFFYELKEYRSKSYQTLISLFFQFSLWSLAISKYRQYFLMLQTLKLNNKKTEKIIVLRRKKFGRIDSGSQFKDFFAEYKFLL